MDFDVEVRLQFNSKTGAFQVEGPFQNPLVFHGLLGMATDALNRATHQMRAEAAEAAVENGVTPKKNGKGNIIIPRRPPLGLR